MTDIVLATANARYSHTALALRSLLANLGELKAKTAIMEFTIKDQPLDMTEKILKAEPKVVGLSVYLWNVTVLEQVVVNLKKIRPQVKVVLGGPEVSFELEGQPIVDLADYVVKGEGEIAFKKLCNDLLSGHVSGDKVISSPITNLDSLELPYHLYTEQDIAHRVIYVEASRGCPFGCEFCLSSLDEKVRRFKEDRLLEALGELWERGARRFKFLDRALHLAVTPTLLEFFLNRFEPGLFLHFELVPDRFPKKLFPLFGRFPPGTLQLEAGIQTTNPEVASSIGRKQDCKKVFETLTDLIEKTGVHVHTDLVVGLPGETLESFANGFNRLVNVHPQEIQVGILKRLRGAPIDRHTDQWEMVYNPHPPYDILQNQHIDFATMQHLKRFARYFDLIYNSGNFTSLVQLMWQDNDPFDSFSNLTDWLYSTTGQTNAIALNRLAGLLFTYVTTTLGYDKTEAANRIFLDFNKAGRKGVPGAIQPHVTARAPTPKVNSQNPLPPRQQRHAVK